MSSVNKDNITFSFPFFMPFISFYYLISEAGNYITCLIGVVEREDLCLVLDLRE
jgi:hypothetical protein